MDSLGVKRDACQEILWVPTHVLLVEEIEVEDAEAQAQTLAETSQSPGGSTPGSPVQPRWRDSGAGQAGLWTAQMPIFLCLNHFRILKKEAAALQETQSYLAEQNKKDSHRFNLQISDNSDLL